MNEKYQALFTPRKIGNAVIKNVIVTCPMGETSLFGRFELTGCHFDKEVAILCAKTMPTRYRCGYQENFRQGRRKCRRSR